MAQDEPLATRHEVNLVRTESARENDRLRQDLQALDINGSRGTIALQTQMTEVVKDLGRMVSDLDNQGAKLDAFKIEVRAMFEAHNKQHDDEVKQRVRERRGFRRWIVGTIIAAIVALATVGTLLTFILQAVSGH